jgi:glycosyltransferase involved in cell wall biosynthesis
LSILMTNFNEEEYIHASIESVLNSTFEDFELIIVDDGSRDSSIDIIKFWLNNDSRVKLIESSKNFGIARSKNLGLSHCNGELIAMMDADDICLANRFQIQVEFMDANPEISLAGGAMYLMQESGDALKQAMIDNLEKNLMISNVFNHPTIIIRRHLWESGIFRYSERFRHTEDYRLWTRLSYKITMANLACPLLLFRANKMASRSNSARSPFRREIELFLIRFLYLARLIRIRKCNKEDVRSFFATILRSTIPSVYLVFNPKR